MLFFLISSPIPGSLLSINIQFLYKVWTFSGSFFQFLLICTFFYLVKTILSFLSDPCLSIYPTSILNTSSFTLSLSFLHFFLICTFFSLIHSLILYPSHPKPSFWCLLQGFVVHWLSGVFYKLPQSIYKFGLSVCLYPINVKTAEPIGPKFFVGHHVTTGKVYEWQKF